MAFLEVPQPPKSRRQPLRRVGFDPLVGEMVDSEGRRYKRISSVVTVNSDNGSWTTIYSDHNNNAGSEIAYLLENELSAFAKDDSTSPICCFNFIEPVYKTRQCPPVPVDGYELLRIELKNKGKGEHTFGPGRDLTRLEKMTFSTDVILYTLAEEQ